MHSTNLQSLGLCPGMGRRQGALPELIQLSSPKRPGAHYVADNRTHSGGIKGSWRNAGSALYFTSIVYNTYNIVYVFLHSSQARNHPEDQPFASSQALRTYPHWSREGQLSCEAIVPCRSLGLIQDLRFSTEPLHQALYMTICP